MPRQSTSSTLWRGVVAAAVIAACSTGTQPAASFQVVVVSGDSVSDTIGHTIAVPLLVRVTDLATGKAAPGMTVSWKALTGGGGVTAATSVTDASGQTSTQRILGTKAGLALTQATVAAGEAPALFVSFGLAGPVVGLVKVSGDSQRTGPLDTLFRQLVVKATDFYGNPVSGVPLEWSITGKGTLIIVDSLTGALGVGGVTFRGDSVPGSSATVTATTPGVLDTVRFYAATIGAPVLTTTIPIPANYGLHDTFIRNGIAFLCAWNSGVYIYDVGNGAYGGTPSAPVLISNIVTATDGVSGGTQDHNAWWFWNPVTGEKRYLFVGQEGPAKGGVGVGSSGDIHVVDVSDLANPVEVGQFSLPNAGTHNFWMDEAHQILYAAYYNGGVVSIDVSGTLSGDSLSNRMISEVFPGGGAGNTYTWGVQLVDSSLYAIDMLSGLWQLSTDQSGHLAIAGGGNNVPLYFSSDLGVANGYAYTGTWDWVRRTGKPTSVVSAWKLGPTGAPFLVDTIQIGTVSAISDVKVSPSGKLLMFSTEGGGNSGFYFFSLTDPSHPAFVASYLVATGIHTAKFATINGRLYAFGAKDPANPALIMLDVTSLDF